MLRNFRPCFFVQLYKIKDHRFFLKKDITFSTHFQTVFFSFFSNFSLKFLKNICKIVCVIKFNTKDAIMKKAEFIQAVAEKSGLSKKDVQKVIDAALDVITETLKKGEEVAFIGFGTFTTSLRAEREAKVPGTDRVVKIPATRVVKFKVGKKLKEVVAGQ